MVYAVDTSFSDHVVGWPLVGDTSRALRRGLFDCGHPATAPAEDPLFPRMRLSPHDVGTVRSYAVLAGKWSTEVVLATLRLVDGRWAGIAARCGEDGWDDTEHARQELFLSGTEVGDIAVVQDWVGSRLEAPLAEGLLITAVST